MNIDIHKTETGFVACALQELEPITGEALGARLDYLETVSGRGYWSMTVTHFEDLNDMSGYTLFRHSEQFDRIEYGDEEVAPPAILIPEAISEAMVRLGYEKRGKRVRVFQYVPLACLPLSW
jgi:hypothetical protein